MRRCAGCIIRWYAPFSLLGLAGFIFGFYLIFATTSKHEGFILAGVSFIFLLAVCILAYFGTPVSQQSGRPMTKYRRVGGPPGETELIYVDHASRTFCRRIAATIER